MSQPLIGPLPYPPLPAQPTYISWCTAWSAYDVPRLWDTVRLENDRLGWEQSVGFKALAELLVDHYRRLRTQHGQLLNAWQSPAAVELLSRVDSFSTALLSDAHCAQTTAVALDGIMATYADAHLRIRALSKHWDSVTSDWVPEWWDEAADELNMEARAVMKATDDAVADLRTKIIIPQIFAADVDSSGAGAGADPTIGSESGSPQNQQPGVGRARFVPAVPGYDPVVSARYSAGGAELAGVPTGPTAGSGPVSTPAIPGQPVSMLPIPPGSQYAPYGGAYVLPGPGVGRGGYIVQMPRQGVGQAGMRSTINPSPAFTNAQGRGTSGPGMMPIPGLPGMSSGTAQGESRSRRRPDTVWEIAKGVPPIIEPVGQDTVIPNQPSSEQEEAFKDWFAELAYPWRADSDKNDGQPQILLRRSQA